jgi:uncharacterized protein YggE
MLLFNSIRPSTIQFLLVGFVFAFTAQSISQTGLAQERSRFIEVVGIGIATEKPDVIVIDGFVAAKGETAKEVREKFEAIKKKLAETINPMDLPNITANFSGAKLTVNQNEEDMMMMMQGGNANATDPGFSISQPMSLEIKTDKEASEVARIAEITKMVDTVKDLGVSFAEESNPMIHYSGESTSSLAYGKLIDETRLKKAARSKAFENAREQAEELVSLSGGQLGRVISIKASVGSDDVSAIYAPFMDQTDDATNRIDEIGFTETLTVRFELKD